ncbi:putative 6-phosphofructo-2-kinase/fructose-2,6-biphosphatase [Trypanosoma theileri]|uniref:Putative 6-phosphofructo-2-kinase/fructose-2,6-biphosphatase n=1 Tax=Trypanosoma theileri TaxID=67003 RepID=A0A1X0P8R3_9TRYP|nr:putative 6-phosphofructo-2-kinase/fructose-2,6-biphosphatase [Trypanosoma theileri]ORC93337.1 putative 6-phosphofructo-2-kinase/fructose-2,6-biphosphatase [Trypanosoma theileri]
MLKTWQPRGEQAEAIERQRRLFPSSVEEACAYGSLAHVITFWAQGQELKNRVSIYEGTDATPLMWAALRGHQHVVRFLLDQEVDVNSANSMGHTALLWALTGGHYEIVRLLLDNGADIKLKDKQGYNAYFLAVQNNNLPMLLMLCEFHPIEEQDRDEDGHSLMHWAAYNNSAVICQYLIEKCHLEINTPDNNGRTPLIWAAREGYAEVIEYLLSCGARTDLKDMDGYTALQYAQYRNHRESVYVLTQYSLLRSNGFNSQRTSDTSPSLLSLKGYTNVQENRRRGTITMMLREPLFFFMSIFGSVHVLLSFLATMFIPPILSHAVLGPFFFKNTLWMLLLGHPVQGGKPELTSMQKMGIASNFADSIRGIWLFRNRDASCLFALITFLIIQQLAWAKMGLAPILWYYPTEQVVLKSCKVESIFASGRNRWWGTFFESRADLQQFVVVSLLCITGISVIMCKLLAMRSVCETKTCTLETSPVWPLIKKSAYRWFHPRILWVDRHIMIPLRTFYCYERDVLLRRFDSYSIALDCPIAESNHIWFFIFVNSFATLQWIIFSWTWEQTSELLECPEYASFGEWFIGSLWNLLIHGLPCRDDTQESDALDNWRLWLQYILPTSANHLGVWLLQFTFFAAIMSTFVVLRQWSGVARGATRMEMANPTATSSIGGLVSIFPSTSLTSEPWVPPESVVDETAKLDTDHPGGSMPIQREGKWHVFHSIYANSRNPIVNIGSFLIGIAGRRWQNAMAISPTNTPASNIVPLSENAVL